MTVGVFDSGAGGLTVLREIRRALPAATLVYIGDSIHAPYGPRSAMEITALSLGQARFLRERFAAELLVVACNTATAAAVGALREQFPCVPIVGMEPAVKPAVAATISGVVGVLATVGTLNSARFAALLEMYGGDVRFLTQPCPGWVEAVEAGDLDSPETRALIARDVSPLLDAGADTLVLGCTHFPALRETIQSYAGPNVMLIDTGEAVARRVSAFVPPSDGGNGGEGDTHLFTTGDPDRFAVAARAILGLAAPPSIGALAWKEGELVYAESGR